MRGQTCIVGCIEQLSRLFMFWFVLEKHKYPGARRLETDIGVPANVVRLGGVLYFK
jgi:hypothetical protein